MVRRPGLHGHVTSRKVPQPALAGAQAVSVEAAGAMLFVSGQLPLEPPRGLVFSGDMKRQTQLVFGHVRNCVMDAGFSLAEVVRCTLYLTDMKHAKVVHDGFVQLFSGMPPPAMVMLAVAGLPDGVGITVDAIAVKPAAPPPPPAPPPAPYGLEEPPEDFL